MDNQPLLNNPDLIPFLPHNDEIKELFSIRNKRGQNVPYVPNASQLYYRKHRTRRNIILKGRQQGLSKEIDADQLADCIKKSTNAVVISHEKEATKRLFAAVKYYLDSMEVKPTVSIDSKQEMKFPRIGSSYFLGTAGQRAFGRGDTIDRAHLSEAAFYNDLEMILSGVAEAAEYGQIDIESTPNGRNFFYDLCQKAKSGQSPYTLIFIPWFIHEEYTSDKMSEAEKKGLSPAVQKLFDIPEGKLDWTDEEKKLWERVNREYNIQLTEGQIKWRRYKIWDKGEIFFQEYPEDDESCFLQSGRAVFKVITTDAKLKIPLDNISLMNDADKLRLLGNKEKKIYQKTLYAAIDPAEGTMTGDSHVLSVIEANSPYHPENGAVVIFEMHSNEPIDIFAKKAVDMLNNYDVILGIEHQGVGVAMGNEFKKLDYYFEEWNTTGTSRPIMIVDLESAYRKGELIETYVEAEAEARNMIYNSSNRPEHPNGKHDDRVFSRAIALQMLNRPKPSYEEF
jgi:hypothetical protein